MKDYSRLKNGNDIRGVALKLEGGSDVNLTEQACSDLAQAFAFWLSRRAPQHGGAQQLSDESCRVSSLRIAVGRDSRLTGEHIEKTVAEALNASGVQTVICGLSTTPSMFMTTKFPETDCDGAIMITASHLPKERNGLKFFTPDGCLSSSQLSEIIKIAETNDFIKLSVPEAPEASHIELLSIYAAHLRKLICDGLGASEDTKPLDGLHVAVDAGNGAGGFFAKDVLRALGADITGSQFLEPDGNFPNHIPNPENAAAMESICEAVKRSNADLGIIFDTDVDRASAVGSDAKEIGRNRIVALAAAIAAQLRPGTTIVTDSITSTQLRDFIENSLGCCHYRFKRGYKNVIDKGMELNVQGTDCQLAIETSGHAAMKENYFLDDGAYLATKIVIEAAKLKKEGRHIEDLISSMQDPLEAKELRFAIDTEDFGAYAQTVLDCIEQQAPNIPGWSLEKPNYEGVRVNVPGGWFLIRKSLHDPQMPVNFESDIEGGVEKTEAQLRELIKDFDKLK